MLEAYPRVSRRTKSGRGGLEGITASVTFRLAGVCFVKYGTPRVWIEFLSLQDKIGMALHPLRRAASSIVFVNRRPMDVIAKRACVSDPKHALTLLPHLRLVAEDGAREVANRTDRRDLATALYIANRAIWAQTRA